MKRLITLSVTLCLLSIGTLSQAQTTVNLTSQCDCEVFNGAGVPTPGAPAVDVGDIYIDDNTNLIYKWDGTAWQVTSVDHDYHVYDRATDTRQDDIPLDITNDLWTNGTVVWGASSNVAAAANAAAWGESNTLTDDATNSAVFGSINTVSGESALALGEENTTSGNRSITSGFSNLNEGHQNIVTGNDNSVYEFLASSRGYNSNVSGAANEVYGDALIVGGANNDVGAAGLFVSNSLIVGSSNTVGGSSGTARGHRSLVAGNNNVLDDAANVLMVGSGNSILTPGFGFNNSSIVGGQGNALSGSPQYSAAWGLNNVLTSRASAVWGSQNDVSANFSAAWGQANEASGLASTAFGSNNTAAHDNSLVIGQGATSTAAAQLVGRLPGGVIFQSSVGGTTGVNLASGASTWASISDRRAKNTIEKLSYGLDEVVKMNAAEYNYNGHEEKNLGFVAQEMLELIPEIVNVPENEDGLMSIRYSELIPVLTNAIQEQQKQIEELKAQNSSMQNQVDKLTADFEELKLMFLEIKEDKNSNTEIIIGKE